MEPQPKKFYVLSNQTEHFYYGESMIITDGILLIHNNYGELVGSHNSSNWLFAYEVDTSDEESAPFERIPALKSSYEQGIKDNMLDQPKTYTVTGNGFMEKE